MNPEHVVVKIGSSSLTEPSSGLSLARVTHFADQVAGIAGSNVTIVSSGAVAAGFRGLGLSQRPKTTTGKQAAAAIGQGKLIAAWASAFAPHSREVAQVLLTRHDFSQREAYQNALATFEELHKAGCIPIVNENDTVAVDELNFGDNDMLAAMVAGLLQAQWLVIATDIDGLYDADPRKSPNAKRIPSVKEITEEIRSLAGGSGSSVGTGGMQSKIRAAEVALSLGVRVFIGQAPHKESLREILLGNGAGTYFGSGQLNQVNRKRQWVAFHAETSGQITIDGGAARALSESGKSLLPAGIKGCQGNFVDGDVVTIVNEQGEPLGRGISNYSAEQVLACLGKSSQEARLILKHDRIEVVHRDYWIKLDGKY